MAVFVFLVVVALEKGKSEESVLSLRARAYIGGPVLRPRNPNTSGHALSDKITAILHVRSTLFHRQSTFLRWLFSQTSTITTSSSKSDSLLTSIYLYPKTTYYHDFGLTATTLFLGEDVS